MENRRRRPRYAEEDMVGCPPRWIWLLAGILIGMFASFLFYLREITPLLPQEPIPSTATLTSSTTSTTAVETGRPKVIETPSSIAPGNVSGSAETDPAAPRFEFYDLLPKAEVKVPSANRIPLPGEDLPVTAPGKYLLQVGLFRDKQPAEGLQTHLANLGISADIGRVTTDEGEQWYRVQVGPFADLEELNQTRAMLSSHEIATILLKF